MKKFLNIILILSISLFLTGCIGGKKNEPTTEQDQGVVPKDRQITLIWWNLFEPQENVQPVIDAYKAKYPNVTIEYSQRDPSTYRDSLDKILTDGIPESTPDIFTIHNTEGGRYRNYTTTPPSQVIDFGTFQKNFYPVVVEDFAPDGNIKGIPLGIDSIAIIYNKKLMSAEGYSLPSDNWNQLFEQAKKLTKKDNNNTYTTVGLSLAADDDSEFWFDVFNLLLLQSNVSMLSQDRTEVLFGQDTATDESISYMSKYSTEGLWNSNLKKDIALFLEGKLAMYIAPSWRLLDIISYNDTYKLGLDVGIAPMPQLSTLENEKVGWSTYWAQTVSIDSKNSAVAWDFLNFASQQTQLRLMYDEASKKRAFGQIYPRPDMRSELENHQYLKVYNDEVNISKTWYMVDGTQVADIFLKMVTRSQQVNTSADQVSRIINQTGYLSP